MTAFTEAALIPGHPFDRLSRQTGIPPEEIYTYINQEKEACLQRGIPCRWDPIVADVVRDMRERIGFGGGYGNGEEEFEQHGGHHGKGKRFADHRGRRHRAQEQKDGEDAPKPGRRHHHGDGGGQHIAPAMTEESEKSPRKAREIAARQRR
ncbi:MAG: hypothetical protein Q9171_007444, partial [Xanthocarpia ochracea]